MILGLSTPAFTVVHVAISVVGIVAGFVTLAAMTANKWLAGWNLVFLVATVATSVTGFLFHSAGFGPPHIIGIISLAFLAVALLALYGGSLESQWRLAYVVSAVLALYLNVFVGVVQAFQKVPLLTALAPTQSEPPFLAVQVVVVAAFIGLGVLCVRRFHLPLSLNASPPVG